MFPFQSLLEKEFDWLLVQSLEDEFLTKLKSFSTYDECSSYLHTLNNWFDLNLLLKEKPCTTNQNDGCVHEETYENAEEGIVTCASCYVVLVQHKIKTNEIGFQHSVCYIPKSDYNRNMVIRRYLESVLRIRIVTTPKKINTLVYEKITQQNLPKTSESVIKVLKEAKQSQYFKFSHSFLYHCFRIYEPPLCSHEELRSILREYERVCCLLKRKLDRKNMIKCDYILRKICPNHLHFVFKKCLPKCQKQYDILWNKIM